MEIIKMKRKNKVTDLILDRQVVTNKRVIDLFVPLRANSSNTTVIKDSKMFGGVNIGS